jgi:catalase
MSDADRAHLISNLAGHMSGARPDVQSRALIHWYRIDQDLGRRLQGALAATAAAGVGGGGASSV